MTDLFDAAAAREAKKAGMAQSEENANTGWKAIMLEMVRLTCREQLMFTTADVFERFEMLPEPRPVTHDKRAMGPVMRIAARNGWCEGTREFIKTRMVSRHHAPVEVWRSKLYAKG